MFTLGPAFRQVAAEGDPHWSSVGLLLRMDGNNDGTIITDSSSYSNSIVVSGGVVTKTAIKKFGSASALIATTNNQNGLGINGAGSHLLPRTTDFTIEGWIYVVTGGSGIIYQNATGTGVYSFQVLLDSLDKIQFRGFDTGVSLVYDVKTTTSITLSNWHFFQAIRNGNTFSISLDGITEGTTTLGSTTLYSLSNNISIGNYYVSASFPVRGYLDDIRFSNVARTVAVPTSAFPNFGT